MVRFRAVDQNKNKTKDARQLFFFIFITIRREYIQCFDGSKANDRGSFVNCTEKNTRQLD